MLGNFPIWDCSMKGTVHFILTIPSGCMLGGERGVMKVRRGIVVVRFPQGL